jgi:hypothetical protein
MVLNSCSESSRAPSMSTLVPTHLLRVVMRRELITRC